jgi:hypothetical protein
MYDHIYNPFRGDMNPHGWVVDIRRWGEDKEVMIKYARPLVWADDPEFKLEGGDMESITFEDFEEYKVSSELPSGTFVDYRQGAGHALEQGEARQDRDDSS